MPRRALLYVVAAVAAAVLIAAGGCGGDSDATAEEMPTAPTWPAPTNALERAVQAGLEPERREILLHHVHAHLDVFVDGQAVTVPAGIGINVEDPGVKHGTNPPSYGGIELCDRPCISPLHTHDETGVVHTESATPEPNTLGQFFIEWGVELDRACVAEFCRPGTPVAVYVDGKKFSGDPRTIVLTDEKQIAIVVGTPPADVPSSYDFSNA